MENQSKHHKIETQITNLPEDLLVKIISKLPTTEEAIRTGILSKRWLDLWKQSSSLSFEFDDGSLSDFVSRVGKILDQCGACKSKLDKFSIKIVCERWCLYNLNNWVSNAVTRKVEDLTIHYLPQSELLMECRLTINRDQDDTLMLPQGVFDNGFLTKLSVKCNYFEVPRNICWAALKNLSLWIKMPHEGLIQSVMIGCPVLEVLELGLFRGFNSLDISSRNLKKLILVDCVGLGHISKNGDETLSAPSIVSLELRGKFDLSAPLRLNVPSLIEVNLDFMIPDMYDPDGDSDDNWSVRGMRKFWEALLRSIHHVNEITFGAWCLEVITSLELSDWLSPLLECKRLKIKGYTKDVGFPGLAMLLRSSPYLEMLHLEMDSVSAYDIEKLNVDSSRHILMVRCARMKKSSLRSYLLQWPEGLCSKLRFVEIVYFIREDRHLKLVQLLLRNANQLEKMIIHFKSASFGRSTSHFQEMVHDAVQKVASFPRSANHVIVQFPDFGNHELS